jgi:cytochrome c biogenesis protein
LLATPDGGSGREITVRPNEAYDLDPNTSVILAEYIPDFFIRDNQIFKRSDDPVNPAFRLQVKNMRSGEETKVWLFPAYNQASQGEKTNYSFLYRDMQMGYFTGLSVSHEPGQWLVWAGVLLMGAGLSVAFYMVHMRLWIVAVPDAKGKLTLWIGGQANKNRDRFEQKFGEVIDGIRSELESSGGMRPAAEKSQPELTLAGGK